MVVECGWCSTHTFEGNDFRGMGKGKRAKEQKVNKQTMNVEQKVNLGMDKTLRNWMCGCWVNMCVVLQHTLCG